MGLGADYVHSDTTFRRFDYELGTSVLGWAFHYFPFYLMQRQLFLHHYFPALYFAVLATAQLFDFFTARIVIPGGYTLKNKPAVGRVGAVIFLALSIVVFALYAPLSYGNMWTKSECERVKLLDTWDWDCNTFHNSYADYSLMVPSASGPAPTGQAAHGPAPPVAEDPQKEVNVTPQVQAVGEGVTEEKIEYRDEEGNLLDDEQVRALEGKVSFSTRYETRTRLVDEKGNELYNAVVGEGEGDGSAGTIADAPEPGTQGQGQGEANTKAPKVGVKEDLEKERSVMQAQATAEPEGEAGRETGRDEL